MALTVENALFEGETVGLRCDGDTIAALGPDVVAQPGDEVIDAGGNHLVPPLVNGHTHAAMTLFRGSGGDLPLMPWLEERIWPVEAKLEAEDVYRGARLACAEMIRGGAGRFWDMYWQPAATARAVEEMGMRATIGAPLIDLGGAHAKLRDSALRSLDELAEFGPLITPALAPHAIYTVSEESLRWIGELSAERNLPVQIHLSETEKEVQDCIAAHGCRPVNYLEQLGLLSERTILAHGVWLDPEEMSLIGYRGATVITNPAANMKLAVGGAFSFPAALAAHARIGLGTDGAGSNDSLDMLAELKLFALVQKHAAHDPTAIEAAEAWAIAIGDYAPVLGSTHLEVGAPADFLLLRATSPELGIGELATDLVYAAGATTVDTTVVAGKVLMRDGAIDGLDEIVAHAAERARGLGL
ncbi:MAG TPA: amidohydrolase [Solirubrobacterales bacterium]|nr:amidohydrolase [Solirubrobacterales bacterium]